MWVIRVSGTVSQTAVRAHMSAAKQWVETNLGEDGEWKESKAGAVYDAEPDRAKIELRPVPDAVGLVVEDQVAGGG